MTLRLVARYRRRSHSPRRPRSPRSHGGGHQKQGGGVGGGGGGFGGGFGGGGLSAPFMSFLKAAGLTAAAKTTSQLGRGGGSQDANGVPGEFGLYLFAQSWAPRFCCTNAKQCKAGGMGACGSKLVRIAIAHRLRLSAALVFSSSLFSSPTCLYGLLDATHNAIRASMCTCALERTSCESTV
jgi:hypothetical protein